MIRWILAGFGLGLVAAFVGSLLRGQPVDPVTGYVAPAPAYGRRAVPQNDRGTQPAGEAEPTAAGSLRTPVGASVSGGR